jgi:hypothetical protein
MQIGKGHAVVVAVAAPGAGKLLVQFVDIGFFFLYIARAENLASLSAGQQCRLDCEQHGPPRTHTHTFDHLL